MADKNIADITNNDSKVLNITDSDFDTAIKGSKIPVLVDFWADWCTPCHMISPIIEQVSEEKRGKLKVVKLNVDENTETSKKYNLRSLPTLILFNNGEQIAAKVGASTKSNILEWIEASLKS